MRILNPLSSTTKCLPLPGNSIRSVSSAFPSCIAHEEEQLQEISYTVKLPVSFKFTQLYMLSMAEFLHSAACIRNMQPQVDALQSLNTC